MPIKLHVVPSLNNLPPAGGVREHLFQLYKFLERSPEITLVSSPKEADLLHVESAYPIPQVKKSIVYTCHGGFLPHPPLPVVLENLEKADRIVSVAQWIVTRFFPHYQDKTTVIPNGIDPVEFKNIPPSNHRPGYVLYGKDYSWYFADFLTLAKNNLHQQFITTYWPQELPRMSNVHYIGQIPRGKMRATLNDCRSLLLTGSEVCPTMLFEAWACGRPVFAKKIDGNAEFMSSAGGVTYLSQSKNILNDFERLQIWCEQFGDNQESRDRIRSLVEPYHWDKLIKRYIALYEELV